MKQLVFLYDRTMDKQYRDKLLLPIHFISYGYINAKMYHYKEHKDTLIAVDNNHVSRKWGNDKVFGAIFLLDYYNVSIRTLDGLYGCSKARLNKNNKNDLMHRVKVPVTLITFNDLDELAVMKYKEKTSIQADAYLGNPNHEWIKHRIKMQRYRVIDGIDKVSFKKMFKQEGVS